MDFDAHNDFPGMANVLEVQTSPTGEPMVVAKQDIDVDQTIVVEDLMFPYPLKRLGMQCNICLKRCENFVPCKTCAVAIFCPKCEAAKGIFCTSTNVV